MKSSVATSGSLALGILLALAPTGRSFAQAEDATTPEVLKVVRAYVDARNRPDPTAVMDLFSHQENVMSIAGGEVTKGWEAIKARLEKDVADSGLARLVPGSMEVRPMGDQHALVFVPISMVRPGVFGEQKTTGQMLLVLEKEQVGWRIVNRLVSQKCGP